MNDREILKSLGFVLGEGFDCETWTNCDNELMAQVWVYFGKEHSAWTYGYDASNGFVLSDFFKWWKNATLERNSERY